MSAMCSYADHAGKQCERYAYEQVGGWFFCRKHAAGERERLVPYFSKVRANLDMHERISGIQAQFMSIGIDIDCSDVDDFHLSVDDAEKLLSLLSKEGEA